MTIRTIIRVAMLTIGLSGLLTTSCGTRPPVANTESQSDETGSAIFVFSEEIHNFGTLKAGEICSFTFTFKNEGTKTLKISEVDSGCGCTKVNISNNETKPGHEGRVEVIYNTSGEVGRQLKTITLFTNAEPPNKQLFIKADIENEMFAPNDFK